MKSRIFILLGLLVLLFIVVTLTGNIRKGLGIPTAEIPIDPSVPVACTMDAKICPDGSYVGRIAPNCEFAACPVNDDLLSHRSFDLSIGQNGDLGIEQGIFVVKEIVEDSRCPVDVTCIQAGTVRVKIAINSNEYILTLNKPFDVEGYTIELTGVIPSSKSSKVTVKPEDYFFTFKTTKIVVY